MKYLFVCLLAGAIAAFPSHASARVHAVDQSQTFYFPNTDYNLYARNVAIDGDSAIAILNRDGGRLAVLFQRSADGQWAQVRTLLTVNTTSTAGDDLVMADGVAAIRIGDVMHVFELSGTNWTEASTAGTPRPAPGMAISARRILAARRGCNYDADVHAKSRGSGVWSVAGRISGAAGDCNDHGAGLDLEGDVALVVNPPGEIREYHRDGTALAWPQVGAITAPPGVTFYPQAPTLHGNVALTSNGHYFRRANGAWDYQGQVEPLNSARGTLVSNANYKGDLLLSLSTFDEPFADTYPYLYRENVAGGFDQVAALITYGSAAYVDVSGTTAVVSSQELGGDFYIQFFTLPTPIVAPDAIANDFEARDISGFEQTPGSSFALANAGSNYVYRQSATAGESHAVLAGSDWQNFQNIEADITPTAFDGNDRWFGLAVRYVDDNNFYYVTLRSSNKLQLKRKVNGAFTTLAEQTVSITSGRKYRLRLTADESSISASVDGMTQVSATDTALTHGRAALMTYRTRADFDSVYVTPTDSIRLADLAIGYESGRDFTHEGGKWELAELPNTSDIGESQTDTSGDARGYFGTPTDDQRIDTHIRLDSYGSSTSGAWFGVLARWVDARNYYYLTLRSTGRLEIRKQLNGTVTVLKSVPFSVAPGQFHDLRFEVLGNELHAYVDGTFMAGAIDGDIAKGRFGLGSYRAGFTYTTFGADQP